MFLDRLRNETAELHRTLERNDHSRRLLDANVQLTDYIQYLEKLFGYISAFEDAYLATLRIHFPNIPISGKSRIIKDDLESLGRNPDHVDKISESGLMSQFPNPEFILGGYYVLEGSTLGGLVIAKHLNDALGNAITTSMNYFTVYGKDTAANWRAFTSELERIAQSSNQDNIIGGAKGAFKQLNAWMNS